MTDSMIEARSSPRGFEAFNARFLTSEEVAQTFIPPPQYGRLVETAHTILLGPRGSGKTTLLKMLQLRALAAWQHESASSVRMNIGYHSIFLGTDVLWGSQLESRTRDIPDLEKRSQIRRTSFRLHLAIAFLNSIEECRDPLIGAHPELKRFSNNFDRRTESELVRGLTSIWLMGDIGDSLLGLRICLQSQLASLLQVTAKLRRDHSAELPAFVDLDPMGSIVQGIELTNHVMQSPSKRWAILCDELEIAPDMVRSELLQILRSSSHSVIFKFSLFPYSNELSGSDGPSAPSAGNDYTPLELYYGKREEAYEFCDAMLRGMVGSAKDASANLPTEMLGDGWFDGGRSHRRAKISPYAPPHGQFYLRAKKLKKIDPSFRRWLSDHNIEISNVHEKGELDQAPYRKALPFILTRSEYLRSARTMRSRKSLSLYTGAYSLFSLTEGNPRIFINLMRPLVQEYTKTRGTVPNDLEAHSIDLTIHRFRASLSAIPSSGDNAVSSVLHLIDLVGSFFRDAQLLSDFSSEPPITFIVDDKLRNSLVELVGRALNAGAFIHMGEEGSEGAGNLIGARLRLAYTLSPEYKLPLVSGRSIALSSILNSKRRRTDRQGDDDLQVRLPFGLE